MTQYHLAQINIAQMIAPMDSPIMADFKNNLERINGLGEQSPGFVWRLKDDSGDATSIRVFDNDAMIINMTVWESIDALYEFAYKSDHTEFFRRRREWFDKLDIPVVVLWWIEAGHIPTVDEAKAKLDYIREHGATPLAFTFKQRFTVEEMLAFSANPA
jgi:hypothetical protein